MDPADVQAAAIEARLERLGHPERVPTLQRFFKTGAGEYGEGDRFLGLRVPEVRRLSREYRGAPLATAAALLRSPYHEARLLAVLLLVQSFRRAAAAEQERIYALYLGHTSRINSWDLVDVSAEPIVGAYLFDRERGPLTELARSALLWDRRIAIMATFHFIRRGEFAETLRIAEILLQDEHDLIHKAVGWMLREVGRRDRACEERFLARHCLRMPRTMLRYAIERFEPERRRAYLEGGPAGASETPLPDLA